MKQATSAIVHSGLLIAPQALRNLFSLSRRFAAVLLEVVVYTLGVIVVDVLNLVLS